MLLNRKDLKTRPLYVEGIPDLKLPHEEIPEGHSMEDWHVWAPTGAILVIDEAQRIFRPRSAGAKVPEHVQALETHRHKGVDIFILTQHPRLLDVNVRSLVGEHRNISNTLLGVRRVSYWARCANPESKTDISEAKNSVFRLHKDAFGLYKSAEEHNKISGKRTMWIYIIPIAIIFSIFMILHMINRYNQRFGTDKNQTNQTTITQQHQIASQAQMQPDSVPVGQYSGNAHNMSVSEPTQPQRQPIKVEDFKPDIEGRPWTAPIYDNFNRNYQTMPYPVMCVKSSKKCTCYTDQATPIRDMDKGLCMDFAENGIYNPYLKNEYQDVQPSETVGQPVQSTAQISELGGEPLPSLSPANSSHLKVIQ
ncbi:zonular occludens toxin domain-containing protein [Wielerella bovis]|uniref:zonular occludens toxin domain-containing protein n=1 Tax=Wielerella bovis TaxID=2917790 RepID=UPI00201901C5|nr:zonular occludens toxin domain-containing protein [Wielerella bovis]ULJ69025.1 zonular occludens toxin domain-containing protein [Wielerella bovis]